MLFLGIVVVLLLVITIILLMIFGIIILANLGIVFIVAGIGCAGYGFMQNNSLEAQLNSITSSGTANPGTMFIVIGVILLVVGIILCVVGKKKN